MYCMQCFLKSNIFKVELSMIKIGELLRKLWSVRRCFLILPPGALTPQGIEGAMKCDVSKHWCTLQWCASRGWVIAHEDWTSSAVDESLASCMVAHFKVPIFITRDSEEIMFSPCVFVCVWLSVYVCHDVCPDDLTMKDRSNTNNILQVHCWGCVVVQVMCRILMTSLMTSQGHKVRQFF